MKPSPKFLKVNGSLFVRKGTAVSAWRGRREPKPKDLVDYTVEFPYIDEEDFKKIYKFLMVYLDEVGGSIWGKFLDPELGWFVMVTAPNGSTKQLQVQVVGKLKWMGYEDVATSVHVERS